MPKNTPERTFSGDAAIQPASVTGEVYPEPGGPAIFRPSGGGALPATIVDIDRSPTPRGRKATVSYVNEDGERVTVSDIYETPGQADPAIPDLWSTLRTS